MGKRQVDVRFNLIDDFTAGFNKTIGVLTSGTKKAEKAWKGIENAGKSISHVGDQLTTAVTLPLAGLATISAKEFGEVDKQLRLVAETMGQDKWAAGDLEKAMKDAASNSVFGMQDAADAALNFARQGWDAAQASDMLAPSMALAAGTATDLSTITGGLGNTLKAFGANAEEAAHYTDMMAIAQAQANTDVTSLFDAMSIAGSTAKTVGWSFSDIATLTGVFGDHSIGASKGANALNVGLMSLASPAKDASTWLDKLSINAFDVNGGLKAMPDLMGELQRGFAGLSDQEQLAAASAIFGKEQASKWVTLINGPTAEALQGLKDNIDSASGAAQGMSDALMSGPGGALEKLKSSFDVFKYTVGETVAGAITPFIDKATELLNKFNNMDPKMQQQIIKWAAIAAAVGPVIGIFGRVVSTVGSLGGAFTKIVQFGSKAAGGFKALSSGAGLAKAGLAALSAPAAVVIAVIAAIAVVIASVVTHFDTFKAAIANTGGFQKLQEAVEGLKAAFVPMIPTITKVADAIGNVIAAAAGVAVGAFANLLAGAVESITGILEIVGSVADGITKLVNGDISGALEAFKGVFQGAVDFVKGLFDGLFGTIKSIGDAISSIKIPEWGGVKGLKFDSTEARATGDVNWRGGLVQVHEHGGEIMDLPHGTRIYPHDVSMAMARNSGGSSINIPKLADQIIVREDADIERIGDTIVRKLRTTAGTMGGMSFSGNMA